MTAALGAGRGAAVALLCGFACMAAELAAVRILAPHFGDSAHVWTNVIGVILAALAAGAWWGGWLAGGPRGAAWPGRLLLAAGLLLAAIPHLAGPLGRWLLPADLPLDAAMPALVRGSFVATALLFGPPLLLLGAISPLLVTQVVHGGAPVGRAVGALSAAGTLGSLGGTFAATHWLVPGLGCRATMAAAGGLLLLAAALLAGRSRRLAAPLAGLLGVGLASAAFAAAPLRPLAPPRQLLAERETAYQFLQVQRQPSPTGAVWTSLVINEGLDSFHSLAVDGAALAAGTYYDYHLLVPLLLGEAVAPAALRVLSVGDAAGTLRRGYAAVHPGATVDAVDIDADCFALGDEFFPGPKAPGRRFVGDGRVVVAAARDQWHAIHVDAYAHQVYIPAHLASREFFAVARQRLRPGGVLALNIGALRPGDPVLVAIGGTLAAEFGHALAFAVPQSRNFLLLARHGGAPDPAALAGAAAAAPPLGEADAALWQRIVAHGADPARWHAIGAGEPLVDDRPALDQLLDAGYLDRGDPGTAVVCAGAVDPAGAEAAAFAAARRQDWPAVLDAVASSRAATAYLRRCAGDARWSLRQLDAAAREYAAGLPLADPEQAAGLQQQLAALEPERRRVAAAAACAARNGWLQAAVLGVAALLLAAGARLRPAA